MTFSLPIRRFAAVLPVALLFALPPAHASDDHDHGEAKPSASGPALPRFAASSELFDVVGVLAKDELVVYLDKNASNEPIASATIEIESGTYKQTGKFEAALGEYHFDGRAFAQAAEYPLTITVKAGADNDLLTAELHVHAETAAAAAHSHGWKEYALWAGAAIAALLVAFAAWRAILARRQCPVGLNGGKA